MCVESREVTVIPFLILRYLKFDETSASCFASARVLLFYCIFMFELFQILICHLSVSNNTLVELLNSCIYVQLPGALLL